MDLVPGNYTPVSRLEGSGFQQVGGGGHEWNSPQGTFGNIQGHFWWWEKPGMLLNPLHFTGHSPHTEKITPPQMPVDPRLGNLAQKPV